MAVRQFCTKCRSSCEERMDRQVLDCQVARGVGPSWTEVDMEPSGESTCCDAPIDEEIVPDGQTCSMCGQPCNEGTRMVIVRHPAHGWSTEHGEDIDSEEVPSGLSACCEDEMYFEG